MFDLPKLKTKTEILDNLLSNFLSQANNIDDLHDHSIIMQLFNSVSNALFNTYADLLAFLASQNIETASGIALYKLATERNVTISQGTYASGTVTIKDTSFNPVITYIYNGEAPPVNGVSYIYVYNAEKFPPTGSIYIGRKFNNEEGPLAYTSITPQVGNYYYKINFAPGVTIQKFHNINEDVILAQGGDRLIPEGTIVKTASNATSQAIEFSVSENAIIRDGEVQAENIPIICSQIGSIGNVPRYAIKSAEGLPFPNIVFNTQDISNGSNPDTDEEIRNKIKLANAAKDKGTITSLYYALLNFQANNKSIKSLQILENIDNTATIIFDDGTGYEPIINNINIEQLIKHAQGGELEFQLQNFPVAQAHVKNNIPSPYTIESQLNLSISINGIVSTHTFNPEDFKNPLFVTAEEIVASINSNPNISFYAYTSNNKSLIIIYPKDKNVNNIQVLPTENDAAKILGFDYNQHLTLFLYKNKKLIYQDGQVAQLFSKLKSTWNNTITENDSLIYSVDGTPPITIVLTKQDFQVFDINATVSVSTPIDIWAKVLTSKMPGVTVTTSGERLIFTSNKGKSTEASLYIYGGTLFSHIFDTDVLQFAQGKNVDYILNPQTGHIQLTQPLNANDTLVVGIEQSQAKLISYDLSNGVTPNGVLHFVIDGDTRIIPSNIYNNYNINITSSSNEIIITSTYQGNPVGFEMVQPNDWIVFTSVELDPNTILNEYFKIKSATKGQLIAYNPSNQVINTTIQNISQGQLTIVRTSKNIQTIKYTANDIFSLEAELKEKLIGCNIKLSFGRIEINTLSNTPNGEIAIVAANETARTLGFIPEGEFFVIEKNIIPHNAYFTYENTNLGGFDFNIHNIDSGSVTYDSNPNILPKIRSTTFFNDINPINKFIKFLNNPTNITGALKEPIIHPLNPQEILIKNINHDYTNNQHNIILDLHPTLNTNNQKIIDQDKFISFSHLNFTITDNLKLLVNTDVYTEPLTYTLPFSRKLQINNTILPSQTGFNANDTLSTLPLNNISSFGPNFSFDNYKILRNPIANLYDKILIKLNLYNDIADRNRIGIFYPTSPEISTAKLEITPDELNNIKIILPVNTKRSLNIDSTTSFIIEKTLLNNNIIDLKFTYKTGQTPDFSTLQIGDVALINSASSIFTTLRGIQATVYDKGVDYFTLRLVNDITIPSFPNDFEITQLNYDFNLITFIAKNNLLLQPNDLVSIYNNIDNTFNFTAKISQITPIDSTYSTIECQLPSNIIPTVIDKIDNFGTDELYNTYVISFNTNTVNQITNNDIIKLQNTQNPALNNKLYKVYEVESNQIKIVSNSASIENAFTVLSGHAIRQFYTSDGSPISLTLSSLTIIDGKITLTFSSAHGLNTNDVIYINGFDVNTWSSSTTYQKKSLVKYGTNLYISLINSNTGNQPDVNISSWKQVNLDLNNTYVVQKIDNYTILINTPLAIINNPNTITLSSPVITRYTNKSNLAYPAGEVSDALAFVDCSITIQDLLTQLNNSYSNIINLSIIPPTNATEIIKYSTLDTTAQIDNPPPSSSDNSFSISQVQTLPYGYLAITANKFISAGSNITLPSVIVNSIDYANNYIVLYSKQITATEYILYVKTTVNHQPYQIINFNPLLQTFYRNYYIKFYDALNYISTTDLNASSTYQFTLKQPYKYPLQIDEQVYLLPTTIQNIVDFWKVPVVSNITQFLNINALENNKIQFMHKFLGDTNNIQILGGTVLSSQTSILANPININNKYIGLIVNNNSLSLFSNSTITLTNDYVTTKNIPLQNISKIKLENNKLTHTHTDSNVKLNVQRTTNLTYLSEDDALKSAYRIQKHGDYYMLQYVGDPTNSPKFLQDSTNAPQEGDWLIIHRKPANNTYSNNTTYNAGNVVQYENLRFYCHANNTQNIEPELNNVWSPSAYYIAGNTVYYNKKTYRALQNNSGENPQENINNTWQLIWEIREPDIHNVGIYQIIRVLDNDTLWFAGENLKEETFYLGSPYNLQIYSYNSIMPNDIIEINTPILNSQNIGKYVVSEFKTLNSTTDSIWDTYLDPNTVYINNNFPVITSDVQLNTEYFYIKVYSANKLKLIKKIVTGIPLLNDTNLLIVEPNNLAEYISPTNRSAITAIDKLHINTIFTNGISGYKTYTDLIKDIHNIVYGNPIQNIPSLRAVGSYIDIKPAILKNINIELTVELDNSINYETAQDIIQATVAQYINSLGVGAYVELSEIIKQVKSLTFIKSVVITYPIFDINNSHIAVNLFEKPMVINPKQNIKIFFK